MLTCSRDKKTLAICLTAFVALTISTATQAIDYGVYDARALAMGGTAMAVGNTAQAQYYNPALLSFHDGDEDKTHDGRIYFPTLVVQASNTVESALNAVNDHLDTKLSSALNAFNAQFSATNAGAVATSAGDLRKVLDKLANKDITGDMFIGLSVSEPSDREGGAFYMGARIIGVGTSNVSKADLDLLDEYIAAMGEISKGASLLTVAQTHPNLVTVNGTSVAFKDPTKTLSSSADVGALAIGEWGMALAKEFTFWGQPVSFGITPKMERVDAYRDYADFNTSTTSSVSNTLNQFSNSRSTSVTFNADFGAAAVIADHFRVSIAVKDAFAKDFSTKQSADPITGAARPDLIVKLHPRSRMGLGYVNDSFSIGMDYDLKESTPMANEAPTQNMSFGAEYTLFDNLSLRAGYRQDKTGIRSNATSAGIGYRWRRFVIDASYLQSSDMKAAGFQMGWTF